MLPIAIRIEDKTYQLDLAKLTATPFKVVVNGQTFDVHIDSAPALKGQSLNETRAALHPASKHVPAELHFLLHGE